MKCSEKFSIMMDDAIEDHAVFYCTKADMDALLTAIGLALPRPSLSFQPEIRAKLLEIQNTLTNASRP